MKLSSYIRESLLDDLDDLINASDSAVERFQTIGNNYIVKNVSISGPARYFCNTFDKRKIKNHVKNLYWDNEEIDVYDSRLYIIENKSVEEMMRYICNIILSGDNDKIYDGEYIKSLFEPVVKSDSWFKHLIIRITTLNNATVVIQIISGLAQRDPSASIWLKKK